MFNAGLSFQPGQTTAPGAARGGPAPGATGAQGANPIQQAIKVLMLKFPRMADQGQPIPGPLAMGQGGAGLGAGMNPYAAMLQQLLARSGMSAPTPNVVPGLVASPATGGSEGLPSLPQAQSQPDGFYKTESGFGGPSANQPIGGLKGATTFSKPSFQLWQY